jgi:hypothetical protein
MVGTDLPGPRAGTPEETPGGIAVNALAQQRLAKGVVAIEMAATFLHTDAP